MPTDLSFEEELIIMNIFFLLYFLPLYFIWPISINKLNKKNIFYELLV